MIRKASRCLSSGSCRARAPAGRGAALPRIRNGKDLTFYRASSTTALLRRLGNEFRRKRPYQAYRELGRVIRTIVLLRFLSEPELSEPIQAMTNKVEAFHKFGNWLMFASDVLQDKAPEYEAVGRRRMAT
ncbi:Tn3 family transposase [Streptomyces sp. NPDC048527]|uniref:Tn3 family transposase n=1 Tax=Streptomyces sp. NPDC048527 TaxID=3365568 RepID=UPI0037149A28